jgi:hypothetical protein
MYEYRIKRKKELALSRAERAPETEKLKKTLEGLNEKLLQDVAGEAVPDIDEIKAEFIIAHNKLRVLLGKEPRVKKGG